MRRFLPALLGLFLSLNFTSLAHAKITECEEIVTDLESPELRQEGERLRQQIQALDLGTEAAMRSGSTDLNVVALGSIREALRSMNVPAFRGSSIAAMDRFRSIARGLVRTNNIQQLEVEELALSAILRDDPYLKWLEENYQFNQMAGQYSPAWLMTTATGLPMIRQVTPTPLSVLIAHLRDPGLNGLEGATALMRVMRDFHPGLEHHTVLLLGIRLVHEQSVAAALHRIQRVLNSRHPLSWSLAANNTAYTMMEEFVAEMAGQRFPFSAWLALNGFLDAPLPSLTGMIYELMSAPAEGANPLVLTPHLRERLAVLRQDLGPYPQIDLEALARALLDPRLIRARSYAEFLMLAYPDVAQAFRHDRLAELYREARQIREVLQDSGEPEPINPAYIRRELMETNFLY